MNRDTGNVNNKQCTRVGGKYRLIVRWRCSDVVVDPLSGLQRSKDEMDVAYSARRVETFDALAPSTRSGGMTIGVGDEGHLGDVIRAPQTAFTFVMDRSALEYPTGYADTGRDDKAVTLAEYADARNPRLVDEPSRSSPSRVGIGRFPSK